MISTASKQLTNSGKFCFIIASHALSTIAEKPYLKVLVADQPLQSMDFLFGLNCMFLESDGFGSEVFNKGLKCRNAGNKPCSVRLLSLGIDFKFRLFLAKQIRCCGLIRQRDFKPGREQRQISV